MFSCEFFPPKTDEGMAELFQTAQEIKTLDLGYVSVTYGAGGSTREKTLELVRRIKHEIGMEVMAHLTCVGHSKEELRGILDQIRDSGVENVIALRGDPPKGEANFKPHPGGFKHASELVRFIRENYGFCVAVAGYPEGHPESMDIETDWTHLAGKVQAGGDCIVTQLFFNNRAYFDFSRRMQDRGVTVPIIPGIMPITNFNQIVRFTEGCGAKIPREVLKHLESIKNDAEAVQAFGIDYATKQCEELVQGGAPAIHLYTLNKSKATRRIIENLRAKGIGK
jgi:methylenetetrahydrofolate reductase (NADPH)